MRCSISREKRVFFKQYIQNLYICTKGDKSILNFINKSKTKRSTQKADR